MNRRYFNQALTLGLLASGLQFHSDSFALSIDDLTNTQASQGLKAALEQGARAAVALLGQPGGFLNNANVRIALPGALEQAASVLRKFGQGKKLDELVVAMNQAAEQAVPLAKDMLVSAVKSMNVQDAKNILKGGDTSVTQFFSEKTRAPLSVKFLPVAEKVTARVNLAERYNQVVSKGGGLIKGDAQSIERYVTGKSLDGLYFMIGEEEKKIRQNPMGAGSAVLQKVFGALK